MHYLYSCGFVGCADDRYEVPVKTSLQVILGGFDWQLTAVLVNSMRAANSLSVCELHDINRACYTPLQTNNHETQKDLQCTTDKQSETKSIMGCYAATLYDILYFILITMRNSDVERERERERCLKRHKKIGGKLICGCRSLITIFLYHVLVVFYQQCSTDL